MIDLSHIRRVTSSIRTRLTVIAVLISFISLGIGSVLSIRWLTEEIHADYEEKALLIATHIIHDLETGMLLRVHQEISGTLDLYKRYKDVEEVKVFSLTGQEVLSNEKGPLEPRVAEVLRTGEPIRFHKQIDDRPVTSFVVPIKNRAECHSCHDKNEARRGALLLSLNQEAMEKYVGEEKRRFLILFGFLAVAISAGTLFAVNRLLLRPLSFIKKGTEAVARGQFNSQIPIASRDEVGGLAEDFNRMAATLATLFDEINDKKRQLQEQFMLVSRSQKEWQETFDWITDPIAVVDADCTIIRANRAFRDVFQEFFSAPKTEGVHGKCHELFGSCPLADCPHKAAMREKRPIINEVHGQRTGRIFQVSLFPYASPEGDVVGSVAIIKDITESKERELQLIMSERLSALGQMASGIAHEIMNPMATIALCAEGLLNRLRGQQFDPTLFEAYLRTIEEEVEQCRGITTSMLSLVRRKPGEGETGEVSVNEVLDSALHMIEFQGRLQAVELLRDYGEGLPPVQLNEGELRQVLLSIVLNALDAMEDKGKLTLETGAEGSKVFVKLSDTGHGIPPEIMGRIFDPFFSTRIQKGGTGLGLSIARRIIKENGGDIEVTSEEGKGTTFKIILPV